MTFICLYNQTFGGETLGQINNNLHIYNGSYNAHLNKRLIHFDLMASFRERGVPTESYRNIGCTRTQCHVGCTHQFYRSLHPRGNAHQAGDKVTKQQLIPQNTSVITSYKFFVHAYSHVFLSATHQDHFIETYAFVKVSLTLQLSSKFYNMGIKILDKPLNNIFHIS